MGIATPGKVKGPLSSLARPLRTAAALLNLFLTKKSLRIFPLLFYSASCRTLYMTSFTINWTDERGVVPAHALVDQMNIDNARLLVKSSAPFPLFLFPLFLSLNLLSLVDTITMKSNLAEPR